MTLEANPLSRITRISPSRTVISSFTPRKSVSGTDEYEEGDWVLDLQQQTVGKGTLASSLSNSQVLVYDQERLISTSSFTVEPGSVATELSYGADGNSLWAATNRGTVWGWDMRSNQPEIKIQLPKEATSICSGYGGSLIAVGTAKEQICFLDVRQKNIVGSYVDSHTGSVNRVRFITDSTLVSAGEDGLVNVFDTRQPTEDQAIEDVWNVGAPVRRFGQCAVSHLYALTGNESLSLYDISRSTCVGEFSYSLRQDLARVASFPSIDYLVDAQWDESEQGLIVLGGCSNGDAGTFKLTNEYKWDGCHALTGGHKGVVRAWAPTPRKQHYYTAGEDARICEWNATGNQENPANSSALSGGRSTRPIRRRHRGKLKASPY